MSEQTINVILAILAVIALAAFVAMGGDGTDLEEHATWMARTEGRGTCVIW